MWLCRAITICSFTAARSPPRPCLGPRPGIQSRQASRYTGAAECHTCGRQFRAVKIVDDLAALCELADVGHKDRLMDDRSARAFLFDHGCDGAERIVGLLAERGPRVRDRRGKHVPNVVEIDDRIANPLVRHLANRIGMPSGSPPSLFSPSDGAHWVTVPVLRGVNRAANRCAGVPRKGDCLPRFARRGHRSLFSVCTARKIRFFRQKRQSPLNQPLSPDTTCFSIFRRLLGSTKTPPTTF